MAEGQTDRLTRGGCGIALRGEGGHCDGVGWRGIGAGIVSRGGSWLEYRSLGEEGPRGLQSVGCSPDSRLTQSSLWC